MASSGSTRKLIEFDPETWQAVSLLSRDSMKTLQELADEAFSDLLKKHRRPTGLKQQLRESARQIPANDPEPDAAAARKPRLTRKVRKKPGRRR
jgi:hypothetical protein